MQPTNDDLLAAYHAALVAVDPRAAVVRAISYEGGTLKVGPSRFVNVDPDDIVVVALGKAAPAMATGAYEATRAERGLVVTNDADSQCPYAMCIGSHPIPDESSLACADALLRLVSGTAPSDVVLFLISGGGSATASLPVDAVSIGDLAVMNGVLIESGMPIDDINEVRAAVSRIKGGRLQAATSADRSITLVLSDVVGAGPEHVASGPTIGFGLGAAADAVIDSYGVRASLPPAITSAIRHSEPVVARRKPDSHVIGSPEIAADSAGAYLTKRGFKVSMLGADLRGEARDAAIALIDATPRGTVGVAAGETTVTLRGDGLGGRNQEAALAAARHLQGRDILFAALGTDGIDGPTDAAGAIVDGGTATRAHDLGIDLEDALARNDSHRALDALGVTVVTGPSGTNVADLWLVAKGPF